MDAVHVVIPHSTEEMGEFAAEIGCSFERAEYIESMRNRYISWEHDYVSNVTINTITKYKKRKKRTNTV